MSNSDFAYYVNRFSPIGVFDSGIGGISVLEKVHELLPTENLIYVADSHYTPYGDKDKGFIQDRCRELMKFFLVQDVKAVVVACNTATAAAVHILRNEFAMPIIGMEPALKPAAERSISGVIGVLATAGTLDSDKFIDLHSRFSEKVEIITRACPGLVEAIEQQELDIPAIRKLLLEYTELFRAKGGDTLVLGCTHYALITDIIREVVGEQVTIIDTGIPVARELKRRLQEVGMENPRAKKGVLQFFSSGELLDQYDLISRHWLDSEALTLHMIPRSPFFPYLLST